VYLNAFRESREYYSHCERVILTIADATLRQLQDVTTKLMEGLVTALHMCSASHEVLFPERFRNLCAFSERCRIKALFELDRLAMLLYPEPLTLNFSSGPWTRESVPLQGSNFDVFVTENDIDLRISAEYDHLLRLARYRSPELPSINMESGSIWAKFGKFVAGEDDTISGGAGSEARTEAGPFARITGVTSEGYVPLSRGGYEPPSYESAHMNDLPDSSIDTRPKKRSFLEDDDNELLGDSLAAEYNISKAKKDREADEELRKAVKANRE
jgi:hypothetical protein